MNSLHIEVVFHTFGINHNHGHKKYFYQVADRFPINLFAFNSVQSGPHALRGKALERR